MTFEIGQRVREKVGLLRTGEITYHYCEQGGEEWIVVRIDGDNFEGARFALDFEVVPLDRGDEVRREVAHIIPPGTIVRDADKTSVDPINRVFLRRDGYWFGFGLSTMYADFDLTWPVTVIEPAGDDE